MLRTRASANNTPLALFFAFVMVVSYLVFFTPSAGGEVQRATVETTVTATVTGPVVIVPAPNLTTQPTSSSTRTQRETLPNQSATFTVVSTKTAQETEVVTKIEVSPVIPMFYFGISVASVVVLGLGVLVLLYLTNRLTVDHQEQKFKRIIKNLRNTIVLQRNRENR